MALSYETLNAYIDGLYGDGVLTTQEYNDIILYILANGEISTSARDLIQVRRGNLADIPVLAQGEIGFTLDEENMYVGGINGNVDIGNKDIINQHSAQLVENAQQLNDITYIINASMSQTQINILLQSHSNIKFLNGIYNINPSIGIVFKSNQQVELESNVIIHSLPSEDEHYKIFSLNNITNVKIKGGTIKGDRYTHIGATGEWGHGINIFNCSNITIEDIMITECWGDSVYLGATETGYNENIKLKNVICKESRRQGISVISVVGLDIDNCQCNDIFGTSPECGVDFEPNFTTQKLERITVNNLYTSNTSGSGLKIYASGIPYIDIVITNHRHNGGEHYGSGFDVSGANNDTQQKGKIININSIYKETKFSPFIFRNRPSIKARVEINNPLIINCNTAQNTSPKYGSAFPIFSEDDDSGTLTIGNIHIFNPAIIGDILCDRLLYVNDSRLTTIGANNISINNPTNIVGCDRKDITVSNCTNFYIEDVFNVLSYTLNTSLTLSSVGFYSKYSLSVNASSSRTLMFNDSLPIGVTLHFINLSSIKNYTLTNVLIVGFSNLTQNISIPWGASLIIHKISETQFIIVNKIGDITVS